MKYCLMPCNIVLQWLNEIHWVLFQESTTLLEGMSSLNHV